MKSCFSLAGREREDGHAVMGTPSHNSFWKVWREGEVSEGMEKLKT